MFKLHIITTSVPSTFRGSKSEPMKFTGFSKFGMLSADHNCSSNRTKKKRKQASALRLMTELGSESNAHGLAKIATSVTTKRKVLWSLLVIVGFTAATLQLSFLVQKYLSFQVVEVSNMKEGMPVEFPSVTICNIATISITKVNKLLEQNSSDIRNWFEFIQQTNFGKHNMRMDTHQAFYENLPEEARSIGHSIENFVVNCRFNQRDCGPANFSLFFDGKNYYNCYTFNSGYDEEKKKPKDEKLLMHTTGPQNGLSLIISLDNDNPTPGGYGIYQLHNHIAFSAGVRAQVHAPNTMPSPADHGFDVPPGYSTSVGLKAILHSRLPHPHGNCTFDNLEGEREYRNTIFTCLQLCKQRVLVRVCGCKTAALPMYKETDPAKGNIPFCGSIKNWKDKSKDFQQEEKVELEPLMCEEKVLENLNNDRSYEKSCGCFQPCHETAYQKSLSLSYWPLEFYQYNVLQELYLMRGIPMTSDLIQQAYDTLDNLVKIYAPYAMQGIHVDYNTSDLNDKIRASDLIRQNLIRLNIYLEDLSIVEFLQMPAYELADLFADIGGTLGLWMGISVLTIMELVELILSLFYLLFMSESDMADSADEHHEHEEKHSMLNHHSDISHSNKYDHFQYDRPLFHSPFDRHAESPI